MDFIAPHKSAVFVFFSILSPLSQLTDASLGFFLISVSLMSVLIKGPFITQSPVPSCHCIIYFPGDNCVKANLRSGSTGGGKQRHAGDPGQLDALPPKSLHIINIDHEQEWQEGLEQLKYLFHVDCTNI